jgi:hypothetical protein
MAAMSRQINRTGLRDLHGVEADIVQISPARRRPRKRFRLSFVGHHAPSRQAQRMAGRVADFAGLLVLALMVSAAIAAVAYVIFEMWTN